MGTGAYIVCVGLEIKLLKYIDEMVNKVRFIYQVLIQILNC